ncbi:MAG: catalase [Archangium sp.]|nr:catalase [Archangium sp.]
MPSRTRVRPTSAPSKQRSPSSHIAAGTVGDPDGEQLASKHRATQALAAAMPSNQHKAAEYGAQARPGKTVKAGPLVGSSTVQETTTSPKVGNGPPAEGVNPGNGPLDRVRVDSTGQALTTDQGVVIGDNQNSLKAGLRGPTLLEDFILREKITNFDHERIPERVVHARGSAAHGTFECTAPLTRYSMAAPFAEAGKRTPVFVRFSTVAGERGSTDTARDVRGFAVKMYTDAGNWDLVGNNMPVFFIQDAMKFPDLIHAVKPEPHHGMPQAASAHDTFWDFVSLMPESTHMLMWVMSDRAIPRSYSTMQGFGVHTFRLINASGASVFCKFHWLPVAGTHSLVWDEAVKLSGVDSDFHRRDLWESIEAGRFPQWDLAVQIFTEEQADAFSFDVLDPTKLVPEELVPLKVVGRLVLNRNPDNFFAETEQVAFCTAHVIPGIDFSNDPLLAGRHHSYVDTQLTRLGGPNFNELPINAPVAQVHNNQRDGLHRQAIHRGRVSYEPNSLGGGCPFQAGAMKGFSSFPQPIHDDAVRGKPEKFADHFTQAALFWNSQSPVEQRHIVKAFCFELSRVQTQAVRERVVSMLVNVDQRLADEVADGLGFDAPAAMPPVLAKKVKPEVTVSKKLSLFARPGEGGVRGAKVAVLVADGADSESLLSISAALNAAGAVPRFVGPSLGKVSAPAGKPLHVEAALDSMPSVLFDAVVLPGGPAADALSKLAPALDFVREQYRHCKPMLVLGEGSRVLDAAGIPTHEAESDDPGIVLAEAESPRVSAFIEALERRRHFGRESDPPRV